MIEQADLPAPTRNGAGTQPGWVRRMRRSLAFGVTGIDTGVVALAGFLLRGGVVPLLISSAVLPSVIGVAAVTGVDAFGIDGHPTAWLFEVAAVISALIAVWLMLAFVIGSLVDVWLIDAALETEDSAMRGPRPVPDLRTLLDMAAIRVLCLLPLVAAVVWAGSPIYTATYNELTTPSNLATPLPLRVIANAAGAIAVVVLAWLVTEVVAAIAVRRLVLFDSGVLGSIAGALGQIAQRPISTAATVALSYAASAVATGAAMAAIATTFDWCRIAARNPQPLALTIGISPFSATRDFRPAVFVIATMALGLAWLLALALSGMASAWRSGALSGETAASLQGAQRRSSGIRLGLSGRGTERSGD